MAEPFTIYKTTILYLLDRAQTPLSNIQITSFFLENNYTDYFQIQKALNELQDYSLLTARPGHRNTQYLLTPSGKDTLRSSTDKLTDGIREDVYRFLEENQIHFREENAASAYYCRTKELSYAAVCRLCSDEKPVLELTLTARTKPEAEAICRNWEKSSQNVYHAILDLLVQ